MSHAALTVFVDLFVSMGYTFASALLAFFIAVGALACYNHSRPVWTKARLDLWSAIFLMAIGAGGSLGYYACIHFAQSPQLYGNLLDVILILATTIVSVIAVLVGWRYQRRQSAYRRAARYYC